MWALGVTHPHTHVSTRFSAHVQGGEGSCCVRGEMCAVSRQQAHPSEEEERRK